MLKGFSNKQLAGNEGMLPPDLAELRAKGEGPWSPEAMEEDRRRLAEFERTRMGVPWEEVKAWVQIGRKPNALPIPQPTNYEARCLAGGSLELHAIKYQNQNCARSDDP